MSRDRDENKTLCLDECLKNPDAERRSAKADWSSCHKAAQACRRFKRYKEHTFLSGWPLIHCFLVILLRLVLHNLTKIKDMCDPFLKK